MSGMAQEVFDFTNEQREIREVCRDFAAREIRPIALEVDEADTEMPWEVWYKAAGLGLTSFMLPSEYGGGGPHGLPHRLHCPGGALLRLLRNRQPDHLGRLLRRADPRARLRGAEATLDRAACRRPAAPRSAGDDGAGLRIRCRVDSDDGRAEGRAVTSCGARRRGSPTAASPSTTSSSRRSRRERAHAE